MIPSSCRPHLIGKGGSNLKALTQKTLTKINVPRSDANKETEDGDEHPPTSPSSTENQPVTITGDPSGVAFAKKEILDLVAAKASLSPPQPHAHNF